jgi:hypothetical protein
MPNKLFEYLSAGLGIWCPRDLTEVTKLVQTYQCGSSYRLEGPQEVARQLVEFLDTANIPEMRWNAYRAAKEKFNWQEEEKKLYEIYQQI